MIHLVTYENIADYAALIEEMFLWRHRIYVEQRGWKEIARPDCREIDQFDTRDAVYLIAVDDSGGFTGSVRLNPSSKPTLLSEVFPHLILRGELLNSPKVWDWTRLFVIPDKRRADARNPVLEDLFIGSMEWAVGEELEAIVGLAEIFWLPKLLKMGWVVDPLGLPSLIEGEQWVPFRCEVSPEILAATQRSFQRTDASVFANGSGLKIAS